MPSRKDHKMARPRKYLARKKKAVSKPVTGWVVRELSKFITGPTGQQFISLGLILFGLLTIATIAGLNSGTWIDGWARLLVWLCGWGSYPTDALFTALGLLWLRHLVHQPCLWRWRPIFGLELALVGLLGLSHTLLRQESWRLVEAGLGGGVIGWALSIYFTLYFGPLITGIGMGLLALLGIGLACDLTGKDLQAFGQRLKLAWQTLRALTRAPERERATTATNISQGVATSPLPKRPAQPPVPPASAEASPPAKAEKPTSARPARRRASKRALPPLSLLQTSQGTGVNDAETRRKSRIIEETLEQFGIPAAVTEVRIGPTVTQFGLTPGYLHDGSDGAQERKVRINQITALSDDLALALAARTLRIEAPVPGHAIVGIEVPNDATERVTLRHVLTSPELKKCAAPLCFAVGLDVAGSAVVADLAEMPHLLIAGTTGSGKSVFVKSLAASLVMRNTPQALRIIALDPKIVELNQLNGLPHLLGSTETETKRMLRVLRWTAVEMDNRYKEFEKIGARNLDQYNRKASQQGEETKPRIVVLIDELADLMMAAPDETERTLTRIAQMARATGIHLVVATQRPSTDVVTGLIKANFPARVSFATASNVDSRVILDTPGADSLLGQGDMLFLPPDASAPRRIQGCFISEEELTAIIEFWRLKEGPTPHKAPWDVAADRQGPQKLRLAGASEDANYLEKALQMARTRKKITTSGIQRQLHISYPRAARLMEELEAMGAVGPKRVAGRKRRVLLGDESE